MVDLERIRSRIADVLSRLEPLFTPDVRLSFFARHTKNPNSHILVSIDSPDEIRRGLDELTERLRSRLAARRRPDRGRRRDPHPWVGGLGPAPSAPPLADGWVYVSRDCVDGVGVVSVTAAKDFEGIGVVANWHLRDGAWVLCGHGCTEDHVGHLPEDEDDPLPSGPPFARLDAASLESR